MTKKNNSVLKSFATGLLQWNREVNRRQMPWKGEKDPYRIWLSEIMLQQTRVEQGLGYYERFLAAFPTVHDLAAAPDMQVYKLWEGLGYYSRCRNLIETARFIARERAGTFPDDYASLLHLKGIGPYTAAAIASFAFNRPHAVLDGNVFRVLSRILNEDTPTDTTQGKKLYAGLAQELLPENEAGIFNQAIMDFGALVCKPAPECASCFFNRDCGAFLAGRQLLLPVKQKQASVRERWFHYFLISHNGRYAIRQRTAPDIWQHLYEFPLIETGPRTPEEEVLAQLQKSFGPAASDYRRVREPVSGRQRLTHQLIHFTFTALDLLRPGLEGPFTWVDRTELLTYPFPKTLQKVVQTI